MVEETKEQEQKPVEPKVEEQKPVEKPAEKPAGSVRDELKSSVEQGAQEPVTEKKVDKPTEEQYNEGEKKVATPEQKPEEKPLELSDEELQAQIDAILREPIEPPKKQVFDKKVVEQKESPKTYEEKVAAAQVLHEEGKEFEAMMALSNANIERQTQQVFSQLDGQSKQKALLGKRQEANTTVYKTHPELLAVDRGEKQPKDVPFASAMSKVYEQFPALANDIPEGPVIAMQIAERALGLSGAVQQGRKQEQQRQTTVSASQVIAGANQMGTPEVTDELNISPELKAVANKMGVTDSDMAKYGKRVSVFGADYYAKHSGMPKPKKRA